MATLVQSTDAMETLYNPSNIGTCTPTSSCPSQHFNDSKFYLLVVIGEVVTEEHLKCAIADIEKGIRSWDTNLIDCNLDQELKLFVSRHSARFSADVRGQRILHHKSNVLETVVLINPSDEAVSTEVRLMISDTSRHKLLVLSGQCTENTGELILQTGSFSFYNFIDIFTDQEIGELLSTIHPANKANLTLSCPDQGDWKNSNLDKHNLQDFINMKLNSVLILPEMEGLSEFTEYLFESVEIPAPFDLLEPPTSGGFLKLSKPCCYIFPGGRGDSALFAVNGFNMLINGGSDRKSCFWKLVRHLDRVDSILLTHIGDDNLPGINSMLLRKMAELEEEQSQGSTANSDWTNNMISPDIGVVFVNLPENLNNAEPSSRMRRTLDEIAMTQQLLAKLNLRVESLQRPVGSVIEPIILFQKMGVGKLEMYVLNPAKNSKEMQYFMKHWKGTEKDTASILLPNGKESEYPVSYLTSISSLIVWHPANPSDKVVRVLFPGNATQQHILEGLEKLKHLHFLKQSTVTQKGMASSVPSTPTLKQTKMKQRADSKESLKSNAKPSPVKTGRKESKEETPEKTKTDSESSHEKTQKIEKKDKVVVKKEKGKGLEIDSKAKVELPAKTDAPEKKKSDIKPKIEKVSKKEPKKLVENKKETKKEGAKKDDAPKPAKKILKRDIKKDLSEDKKEQKKDLKKTSKDPKKSVAEGKNVVSKPKTVKKETGAQSKLKEKIKPKVAKKESIITSSKAEDTCTAGENPEVERSLMSSPEDLTKDFEELRAELLVQDEATVQEHQTEEVMQRENVIQTKESLEALESVDEGINSTEVERNGGLSPEQQIMKCSTREKFEDEGTVVEETSEGRDYEEKINIADVCEPQKEESNNQRSATTQDENLGCLQEKWENTEHSDDATNKNVEVLRIEVIEVEQLASVSHKVSSPVSPAASINDEMVPVGFENSASDDEDRDEQAQDFTVTSGLTQSTIEISSVPTPLDDMSTPKDIMSDETANDDSPTQDAVNLETTQSEEVDKEKLSPIQSEPECNNSDATEGHHYNISASTISPCSFLEDDKLIKEFENKTEYYISMQESNDQDNDRPGGAHCPLSPFIRSPSVESKPNKVDSPSNFAAPIELSTTLAKTSTEDKTLEGTISPQSSGHTPYYQSPVDEIADSLPLVGEEREIQGPVIEEVTSDLEDSSNIVTLEPDEPQRSESTENVACAPQNTLLTGQFSQTKDNKDMTSVLIGQKKNEENPPCGLASSIYRHETDNNNFTTFKEESKMSISEGTTSDKSGTPLEEVVAEDMFSHLASASTASLATSSLPEPTTDSPSLHAEVGSPHSTEVDDSLSVSVVQTPTTFHEAEGSPTKEDSPRPMSISPDISPKIKNQTHMDTRSPEHSNMSAEFGLESPDHSLALDFSKQSPEHPSLGSGSHATENGPTEIDFSPSDRKDIKPPGEKPVLFEECDAHTTSATPSDASQSTPTGTTPCQLVDLTKDVAEKIDRSLDPPKTASMNISTEPPSLLEDPLTKDNLSLGSPSAEIVEKKIDSQETDKCSTPPTVLSLSPFENRTVENLSPSKELERKSPSSQKIPSPNTLPLKLDQSICNVPCGSKDPAINKQSPCGTSKTDVDLCLVSLCEYRHPKTELSPSFMNPNPLEYFISEESAMDEEKPLTKSGGGSRPPGAGKLSSKQCEETPPTSISESAPSQTDSDVPPGTEECPSITADANIDSEDDSETLPTDRTLTYRHIDPPPMTLKDSAPSPGHHDVCMVDPEALKAEENANTNGKKKKLSKKSTPVSKSMAPKAKDTKTLLQKNSLGEGKDAKNATNTSASRGVKSATGNRKGSSGTAQLNCPPMYMDLVYIPNHCNAKNVNAEFFRSVRSSYYVISGNNQTAQEPSKAVLDALLEGKSDWEHNMQVTLIPTHDTDVLREWYQETHDKQQELNIMVLASSSTVVMQDESFPACKIEM